MSTYIAHLQAFRGVAILSIVAAHAWSFAIFWTGDLDSFNLKALFYLTELFFHGSTIYFAIISGLLFSKVLHNRGWILFYKSKTLNVVLPYSVASIIATAVYWQYYLADAVKNDISFISTVSINLVFGTAAIQFWYIPILFVLFILTPFLDFVNKHAPRLMFVFACVPLIISRSAFPDFLTMQSLVYFCGAYCFGMIIGSHYEKTMAQVNQYKTWLVAFLVLISIAIVTQYINEYKIDGWYSSRQTLFYIQKILACLLLLKWLQSIETRLPKTICNIGEYSFSIYFYHVLFVGFLIMSLQDFIQSYRDVFVIGLLGIGNMIIGVGTTMVIAWLIKKIIGRHSRKLIGT
ncbi:acyltransferase [Pseudoalteromonas sp. SG45-5]|nr:acyltransferase [Pseudoalteromonas sp. SG45-5]MBB1393855.1 acyltransferase [Pseudoalteromonas sp. SG44-4]MBB1446095.1 acyltransferase [Pseudoalteromonas sp. SG41-6]